ncbi:MAG: hydrogen peroxide-inducible genes activator, partial [Rhodospirillales bacterium]|nr:hydrogen peroxide-inducible genes activator [Rhodospirillales bacterium]
LPTLGPYLLPHILPQLRKRHPELRLYLREEPGARLLPELIRGDLDLVVMPPPDSAEGLVVMPLLTEPFWVALPLDHALTARSFLNPADLAGEKLLLLEQGHCMRDQVLAVCREGGAAENPDFRATSLDSLRQMVATGLGATLLPALYVAAEALEDDQIAMRPFADPQPGRSLCLAWRRTTTRGDEFRLFGRLLADNLPNMVLPV